MRSIELAKVAASAEALRLRRLTRRQGIRAALGAVAAVFAIAVLVVLHVLLWEVLLRWVEPVQATLIVLALDVVIAMICGFMAMRDVPDSVEQEAKQIRHQALIELKQSLTFMSLVAQTAGVAMRSTVRAGGKRNSAVALAEVASRIIGR